MLTDQRRCRLVHGQGIQRLRHVPDEVLAVPEIPRTLTGKKLELPVKNVLMGRPVAEAVSLDATANPRALQDLVDLARELAPVVAFKTQA